MTWKDVINYTVNGNLLPAKKILKSDEEWQKQLTPEQYRITRQKGTERAFTGAHCSSFEHGKYSCICCESLLFDSSIKFDSHSGWPSFTEPIENNAVAYHKDTSHGMIRVEITCNTCDAHLGHVFPDGPEPTGLRFCVNSQSICLVKDKI